MHLLLIAVPAGAAVLGWKLLLARFKPYRPHRFCGGKGLDPYCDYRGKVLRFGARLVRPELREK